MVSGTPRRADLETGSICLLRVSSSSVFVAPGLKCLKGAMKADNMLTLSGKKRRRGNALLTSSFRKTQRFYVFLLPRVWTREVERSLWLQPLHSGSVFYCISDSILSNSSLPSILNFMISIFLLFLFLASPSSSSLSLKTWGHHLGATTLLKRTGCWVGRACRRGSFHRQELRQVENSAVKRESCK